jgi:ParB-like chromosome segregation protein Spo0J
MAKKTGASLKPPASPAAGGLQTKPSRINLDALRFDPDNPRIVERLGEHPSQPDIEDLLVTGDMRARELIPSFMANGYIEYEPLIVRSASGGKYVVLEGNRRLAALRSMQKSGDADEEAAFRKHRLDRIPCLVFDGGERELLAYLGLRHLSKTKDWSASAKGQFVERVLKSGCDLKEAGRLTNTSTSSLRQLLLTRRLFERAAELDIDLPSAGGEGETVFWHLGDAVRRTRTKDYLGLEEADDPLQKPSFDETRLVNLLGWLYGNPRTGKQKVIASIRDIGTLDQCLGNDRAREVLESGEASLAEAAEELSAAGALAATHLERAKRSIQRAGLKLSDVDAAGLAHVDAAAADLERAFDHLKATIAHRRTALTKG